MTARIPAHPDAHARVSILKFCEILGIVIASWHTSEEKVAPVNSEQVTFRFDDYSGSREILIAFLCNMDILLRSVCWKPGQPSRDNT